MDEKSCVTPAGTSNELDVQNEREENTQHIRYALGCKCERISIRGGGIGWLRVSSRPAVYQTLSIECVCVLFLSSCFVLFCFSILSLELCRCSPHIFLHSRPRSTYRIGNHVYILSCKKNTLNVWINNNNNWVCLGAF